MYSDSPEIQRGYEPQWGEREIEEMDRKLISFQIDPIKDDHFKKC